MAAWFFLLLRAAARHCRHNLQLISIIKVSLPFMGLAGVSRSEVSFFRLPRFSARVSVFQTTTTTITTPPSLPPLVVSLLGLIFAKTSQFLIPRDYSSSIEPLPINRPNFPLHPPPPSPCLNEPFFQPFLLEQERHPFPHLVPSGDTTSPLLFFPLRQN